MKRICSSLFLLLLVITAEAQYKKASFLNKSGRTHELGFSGRFMSQSIGTAPGFYYSYGRDKGKRAFYWFDLELIFPRKFSYITTDVISTSPVTVSGKTKVGLFYRYNFAYYLVNPENDAMKIKPFLTLGLNMAVLGSSVNPSSLQYDPAFSDPRKFPPSTSISGGVNVGLGGIYNLNKKTGLRLAAGYNFQGQITGSDFDGTLYDEFNIYSNHPYVTLGVRFLMEDK